jgi:hypothetical protein
MMIWFLRNPGNECRPGSDKQVSGAISNEALGRIVAAPDDKLAFISAE